VPPSGSAADHAFDDETRVLTLERTRVSCLLGISLVPAFSFLDYLIYPGMASDFLLWRLGTSGVLAIVLALTYTRLGPRAPTLFGYSAFLSVAGLITVLVYRLGGPQSPYYAGLWLVLLAAALVMPWRTRHTATISGIVYTAFALPALLDGATRPLGALANNHFFILSTILIACCGTHLTYRNRRRQFDLSWRLEARSRELARANEQLRDLDAAKARFFANVSHELRTPLTLMLGPLEGLLEGKLPAELRSALLTLQGNARRLSVLIDDLLEVARLDAGKRELRKRPLRLAELASSVVDAAKPFAHQHGIVLVLSVDPEAPVALLDRARMDQVMLNLVSNALKFSPWDGHVEVSVSPGSDGDIVLSVSDNGPGIPRERRATLFERFGHSTESSHAKGSGLGLALVKEHVEAHDGTIELESAPDEGTTFVVRLPLGAPPAELEDATDDDTQTDVDVAEARRTAAFAAAFTARTSASAPRAPVDEGAREPGTILVVDDEAELRALLRDCLSDHDIVEASDGVEGLECFLRHQPDLVLSDIGMPNLDGVGLCKRIRSLPGGDAVPFLFLTARAGDDPRLAGLETGANDYLTKPFSRRELKARVNNFLTLRRYERDLAAHNVRLEAALQSEHMARERAVRAESLASLGRMAIEVGHEVNNPVNFLLNYARPLERKSIKLLADCTELADTSPDLAPLARGLARFPDALRRIIDGGERISAIVQGLRTLAGSAAKEPQPTDVDAEVDASLRLAAASIPERIRVERTGGRVGEVLAPPAGIGQVVTNLISNAVRAIAEDGTVVVDTQRVGDDVLLTVGDDGCGMDQQTRARVFDAFFTTRRSGGGMGVGMAIVHRIVTRIMEGEIECRSEPGQGTEFRIRVPSTQRAGAETPAPAGVAEASPA